MQPALHDGHVRPGQAAEDELPGVVRRGGALHGGHLGIGHGDGVLHRVRQSAQAGTQDQEHLGTKAIQPRLEGAGAFTALVIGIGFHKTPPLRSVVYSFWPH